MENRAELATPMMQQYLELKRRYQEEVLFFRLGDFYEMFLDDAVEVSQILHITLTSRNGIPMCGIPYHAAKNYIRRLLEAGKKVAICEQVDVPQGGKGIARREVVQVVTPGTVIDEDFLDAQESSYVAAVIRTGEQLSCAWSSLTDSLFYMTVVPADAQWEHLRSFLGQVKPREIVVNEEEHIGNAGFREVIDSSGALITRLPPWQTTIKWGYDQLVEHLETLSLKALGLDEKSPQLAATGALLYYLKSHVMSSLEHLQDFTVLASDEGMQLDEATFRNLELVVNLEDGKRDRSLLWAIDQSITAGGGRLLRHNLSFPLSQLDAICERQRHVQWFFDNSAENRRLQDLLRKVPDVVRLTTRISMRRQNVQDLNALSQAVEAFFTIISQHNDYYQSFFGQHLTADDLNRLQEASHEIQRALNDGVQGPFAAGQTIRVGYHQELDYLRSLCANGTERLQEYLKQVKEESGIPTMRLAYNRVIGRYIEVPKTHSDKIPSAFMRKQTLVNAERYTTEALQELESELATSEDRATELERSLYEQLVGQLAQHNTQFNAMAHFLSTIDYYQSLAALARTRSYVKPTVTATGPLLIEEGRHPVVERFLPLGTFVPNPLKMESQEERFCLITGPNMAGKSTYLRQNALIVLLAHIGSFVPATSATIPLVDKLYCRIGASDNIARGESTFLVEMQESAFILRTATERSFVIMDEVGRGTSTQDGMSIAYAVIQDLIERNIKTLFATHYHELTMLDTSAMQLATLEVVEKRKKIHFLRRLKEGVADSSYGLHVAAMAGMPEHVVRLAAAFQKRHFADYSLKALSDQLELFVESSPPGPDSGQTEVLERLKHFDIDHATPVEALTFLETLQHLLND